MINDQLLEYIKKQLALGSSKDTITNNLKSQGWTELDVEQAFININPINTSTISPVQTENTIIEQFDQSGIQTINTPVTEMSYHLNNKKRKIILTSLFVVLFCLIGGGIYAYYSGMFITLPTLASKSLEKVRNISSASYDTTITIDFSEMKSITNQTSQILSGGINSTKLSVTTKGSYDFTNINNKKISSLISFNAGSFSALADLVITNDILYGKLTKAPAIAFLPMFSKYENKWFSFPFKSENIGGLNNTFNPISRMTSLDSNIIDKITPEQREEIYKITSNAHFIKTVKRLSPEIINDEMSYHFIFDLDKQGISIYLKDLKEYVNKIGKNDSALTSFDPTSFSKTLDSVQDFKGEIWIGRKDTLPYKIVLDFTIQPDKNKDEKIKINIVNIFKDWNKPVIITAPTESVSFEKLISDSFNQSREKAQDASIKVGLSSMRLKAETYWNNKSKTYLNFCKSNEVKYTSMGIENQGTEFICKDSKTKFVISAKLKEEAGYFCVDSSGFNGSTKKSPTDLVCPR